MSKYCMGCMEQYGDEFNVCPYCGFVEGTKAEQGVHMEPGSILAGRYIVGKVLGSGGFGVTYIGWDALLEHKVAIKEYLPSEFSTRMPGVTQVTVYNGDKQEQFRSGLKQFVNEAKRLAKLSGIEGIVRIFDAFEENNTAYIVMEYLEGETLATRLEREKTIPPEETVRMMLPVIESLQQVHEQGLIHRDLAPDNLFILKNGSVKVIDFGAARFATTSHSRSLTVIIKPGYSAEEQYRSRSDQGGYTDVYSLGAIMYKMITGITPPDALERRALAEASKKDILDPPSKHSKKLSKNTENAILNAMNIRVEDRTPSMTALMEELLSQRPVARVQGKVRKIDLYRWPLWAKLTAGLAAVAVTVFGVLFATGVIGFEANLQKEISIPENMTRVPSVINSTTAEADQRIKEARLLYTIIGREYSSLIPADYVLTQDMDGGTVAMQNSNVNLVVSGGPQMTAMPDVTYLPLEDAVSLLGTEGFVIEITETFHNVIHAGHVISQSVEPEAEIAIDAKIELVVSLGADPENAGEPKDIAVPDLTGKSIEELMQLAEQYGFMIAVESRDYSAIYEVNTAISQTPASGDKIMTGQPVTVILSMGNEKARVPDVQFLKEEEAVSAIELQGLVVSLIYEYNDSVAEGLVVSQDPAGKTVVEPQSTVQLVISKGSKPFDMPLVEQMKEEQAKQLLTESGLAVTVEYEYSDTVEKGTVLKQSIEKGTQVKKGDSVTLIVSSGEAPVEVPDVVEMTSENAQSTLEAAGFQVTVNWAYDNSVGYGKVVKQSPEAGSSQEKGSTIALTVSLGKDTVLGITILRNPSKTSYYTGDKLDTTGLRLKVSHKSGWEQEITSGFSCSPNTLNTAGTQTITVSYEGCTASFTVQVTQLVIDSIYVENLPNKTSYYLGETLDTTGLTLLVATNAGDRVINSGFSCSPETLNTPGSQDITVSYGGKSTSFTVYVEERPADTSTLSINGLYCEFGYRDWLETTGLIASFHLSSNYMIETYDVVITDSSGNHCASAYGVEIYEYDTYCEFAFTGYYFTSGATYTCTITARDASGATRSSSCSFVG